MVVQILHRQGTKRGGNGDRKHEDTGNTKIGSRHITDFKSSFADFKSSFHFNVRRKKSCLSGDHWSTPVVGSGYGQEDHRVLSDLSRAGRSETQVGDRHRDSPRTWRARRTVPDTPE